MVVINRQGKNESIISAKDGISLKNFLLMCIMNEEDVCVKDDVDQNMSPLRAQPKSRVVPVQVKVTVGAPGV